MLKTKKLISLVCASCLFLSSCAASSESIKASYVSPLAYQNYNCNQISMEIGRISRRVSEVTGQQDDMREKDSVALGVGLIVFWPALFFMIGDDQKEELGRLKGEYEALEKAAIEKECNIEDVLQKQREEQERKKLEKEQEQKQQTSGGFND